MVGAAPYWIAVLGMVMLQKPFVPASPVKSKVRVVLAVASSDVIVALEIWAAVIFPLIASWIGMPVWVVADIVPFWGGVGVGVGVAVGFDVGFGFVLVVVVVVVLCVGVGVAGGGVGVGVGDGLGLGVGTGVGVGSGRGFGSGVGGGETLSVGSPKKIHP